MNAVFVKQQPIQHRLFHAAFLCFLIICSIRRQDIRTMRFKRLCHAMQRSIFFRRPQMGKNLCRMFCCFCLRSYLFFYAHIRFLLTAVTPLRPSYRDG